MYASDHFEGWQDDQRSAVEVEYVEGALHFRAELDEGE